MLRRGIVSWLDLARTQLTSQNFWVKDHRQVYLMGNPVVWWTSTLAIGIYVFIRGVLILREKRGFRDLHQRE